MLSDLHCHSTNSCDGRATVEDMCQRAVELGLERIAFTEHVDFEPKDPGYGYYDYERSLRDTEAARERFGDRLTVLTGIEVDYQPEFHDETARFLEGKQFDLIVGAVHYVHHEWVEKDYVESRTMAEAYPAYFRAVQTAAETSLFQVIAHFDLCKRFGHRVYGPYDPLDFEDAVRAALAAIAQRETALEINTSGLRQPPGEPYPPAQVVRWFREVGGRRVCLGSDAHEPVQMALGFHEAARTARSAGFTEAVAGSLMALD